MIDKRVLRARLRAARDAFVAGGPPAILPPQLFLEALRPGVAVASYVPLGSEADPAAFDAVVRRAGGLLALPRVIDRASPIDFRDAAAPLEAGPFGLTQPGATATAVDPDIILTPLVGFDSRCNRLGQGAGHYDRAFARWPDALRIGIAWSVQRVAALPVDPWDVPLHLIATETDTWIPEPNR
ncbi:5-formyltetrahydrofolate cyclo-ligase [Sphingomonas sp. VNH70]|uniref:5-formyltetrahydrofolate cyclo-ligase n=1 Tax=Sphingomonas silueang TaxID=3156617 RepID=UPI0032B3C5CD